MNLENSSVGLSLNAGFDYKLNQTIYLNMDLKKLQLRSDVLANGNAVTKVKLDPLLIGFGIGWRF